jgi:hypothetical protein
MNKRSFNMLLAIIGIIGELYLLWRLYSQNSLDWVSVSTGLVVLVSLSWTVIKSERRSN